MTNPNEGGQESLSDKALNFLQYRAPVVAIAYVTGGIAGVAAYEAVKTGNLWFAAASVTAALSSAAIILEDLQMNIAEDTMNEQNK